jgi:ATP-dependent DNA ligase I
MLSFALICEQVSKTTKKLEKEKILSIYLRSLTDEDLYIASIFFTGYPFALKDQRVTNVGYAAIRDALEELESGLTEKLGPVLLRTGDLGTAIEELFQQQHHREPVLTLQEARSFYEKLSVVANNREKREQIREMLARATPLEAKYLIKIFGGGMRIGLQEGLVESSIAKAFDQPLEKIQYAHMLLGDIGETAVLARYGRLNDARMKLLHPIKPMLASVEEDPQKILDYMEGCGLAEDKYDGIRAQVHKEQQTIKIFSRDLDDITKSFPDVVEKIACIPHSFLMDGEIVPYKEGAILSFALLQNRLGRKVLSKEMLQQIPCRYFAFDLLFLDGDLFLDTPLHLRRTALHQIQQECPETFSISEQRQIVTTDDVESCFGASRCRNNEGLVIKHSGSAYKPGKRGKQWLKLKRALVTLDVVVVAAQYGHGKRAGLLSDYTFAVQHEGELLTIGKAYSGITDKELLQLSELFHKISIRDEGFLHVVPPQVVFEVTFDRINRSDRHTSGFALRFPRIKNIRWDKKPEEIDTLETVEKLFVEQEKSLGV